MQGAQNDDRPRAVLLGASNLAIGLEAVLRAARSRLGAPLEVLAALGRGRSYGTDSWFLARRMPGIRACGLWRALAEGGDRPTWALVTDVGNDLPFGASPAAILGWVEEALGRLADRRARTVITSLPLENLRQLPAWEFELWRRLIFPLHRTSRARLLDGAEVVDDGLRRLARERSVELVELRTEWYGLDPIHVRRARRAEAWDRILAAWGAAAHAVPTTKLPGAWRQVPERRWILGLRGGRPQPCLRLEDGTTLGLF